MILRLAMKGNGNWGKEMVKVNIFGPTPVTMKAIGRMTRRRARGNSSIKMEISMRESGKMIWQMAKELTYILVGPNMLDNGSMTFSTGRAKKSGPTERSIRVHTDKGKKMEKGL